MRTHPLSATGNPVVGVVAETFRILADGGFHGR